MAWSDAERITMHRLLGYSPRQIAGDDVLDGALTAVQSAADGGVMPSPAPGDELCRLMGEVVEIEGKIKEKWDPILAAAVGNLRVDAVRGMMALYMDGRHLVVGQIAALIRVGLFRDPFSTGITVQSP
ncbi:hypothetical protein [Polyangium sorediatum]|uniref:Uncharacterized protein n=1 Tax=Polyangium sorediatum TaxID=889274 RepID=A0ABT6NSV1_9BACT|nr:hypothetical protein [Polyangium sorediatum]MDI1431411.1 hypothetical protein [Polyangium sorediatum]